MQSFRTRSAILAAAARALKAASGRSAPFSLVFMTDAERVPDPELVARAMPRGAAVILRDYRDPGRAALARRLKSICERRGVLLLIGADPCLAAGVGADGLHWPRWRRPNAGEAASLISTASCHYADDLEMAASLGVSAALLSPVFATSSHKGATGLGADRFTALAARARLPVLALGGVDETNARFLAGPNVAGLAAIGAFLPKP